MRVPASSKAKAESHPQLQLPALPQTVALLGTPGGPVPARVLQSSDDRLLLEPMLDSDGMSGDQLERLVCEFPTRAGRVRLRAAVSVADPSLLCLNQPRVCEVLQEREYVRVSAARPVLISIPGTRTPLYSYSVDLSGGGVLLAISDLLQCGETVRFQLTGAPGSIPLVGAGTVVRRDHEGRFAIAFGPIKDLDRRRLIRFIFEVERRQRRRDLQSGGSCGE